MHDAVFRTLKLTLGICSLHRAEWGDVEGLPVSFVALKTEERLKTHGHRASYSFWRGKGVKSIYIYIYLFIPSPPPSAKRACSLPHSTCLQDSANLSLPRHLSYLPLGYNPSLFPSTHVSLTHLPSSRCLFPVLSPLLDREVPNPFHRQNSPGYYVPSSIPGSRF